MSGERSWLDSDPPADASLAEAYWCEMDYFLAHTATGDHPDCRCKPGLGHRALPPADGNTKEEG